MSSGNLDKKLDKLLDSIKDLIYVVEKRERKDDTHYSFRRGFNGSGENSFLNNRNTINSTDFDNLMNDVMKSLKENLKQFNEDLKRINKELATTTDNERKRTLQKEKARKKEGIRNVKKRIKDGSEIEYERRNRTAKGQLIHDYNTSTNEIKQRYGSARNYVSYRQKQNEYLQGTSNRNDARRMIYESGFGDTSFGRIGRAAIDRQQKIADIGNFSENMKYGGAEKLASAMFGETKMGGRAAKALGGIGKAAGSVSKALTKFGGAIGIIINILGVFGEALKAISEADAKQQDIQNKRNTSLTNRNIELSNIETEGITDTVSTFGENVISQYNKMFTKISGELQIASTKAISSVQVAAESAIGDANKAAWEAFNAQVDIQKEQANLNAEIAKTNAIEGRNIAQRTLEFTGRGIERSYQTQNAVLRNDIEQSRLNVEDKRYTMEHPFSSTANRIIGGSTEIDNAQGNSKWNVKYGGNNNKFSTDSVGGYAAYGVVNNIPLIGEITKLFGDAYLTKQNTVMEKGITDATNSFNAMSAAAKNQIRVNNQVMATTNQIANTVTEGTTEIVRVVNETKSTIDKTYASLAQAVEEYFKQFQKNAFNTGIGQGITNRKQLDSYFKNLFGISSILSRNYGVTSEEVMRMQQDYTAGGRNKMLSFNDYKAQAAFGKELLGGDFGTAAELSNDTEIFNMGVERTVDLTSEMYKKVIKMGLDGRKYIKDLTKDLKSAQKYDFKNGVKGLMSMAAKAQNIRFNMDSLGGILDDIQGGGLENLITKGAKLQVMGGRFAMNADPIAMMYEAFSDPEALMSRFNDMLNGIGRMNSKNGKVGFTGEEQMMLRNFAQITGQSLEDIRAQATYKVKKGKVEPYITDMNLSQDQRASLVNKAFKGEDGQWKVNDIYGNEMNLSDINSNNIKNIESSTYEGKMSEGMRHVVAFTDKFIGATDANNAILAQAVDENGEIQKNFKERLDAQHKDLMDNLGAYVYEINQKESEATAALKTMLSNYTKLDPDKLAKEGLDKIDTFASTTKDQLNAILKKMGGDTADVANKLEKSDRLKKITVGVQGKGNGNKRVSVEDLINSGIAYEYNGGFRINNTAFAKAYGGKANWGNWTKDQIKQAGNYSYVASTNVTKQQQKGKDYINAMDAHNTHHAGGMKDGVVYSNGSPLITTSSKVTKIHDGSVKITQSDPNDTALFAKTGGPFDTLFNGVFKRVNELYNVLVDPKQHEKILNLEPMSDLLIKEQLGNTVKINGSNSQQLIKFDTLRVEMNGKLELTSDGKSVDVMRELQENPTLIRSLSQLITKHVSSAINGGRGKNSLSFGSI